MKKRRRFDYQEKTFHKWTPESATHHNLKYQAVTKAQSGTPAMPTGVLLPSGGHNHYVTSGS